jgi:hypothetical protein
MTARHHHYLSQCYLKGFTKGRAKKSKLSVVDFKEKKSFQTSPRNVGGLRDFNRVDAPDADQNVLEHDLSKFESQAAQSLNSLRESLEFSGDTRDVILNLMALIAVRSPERREHMRQFHAQIAERVMDLTYDSKERWESQVAQVRKENPNFGKDITYEQAKKFFESKKYRINVAREYHIHTEMVQVEVVLPCLINRNWMLLTRSQSAGPFITTDWPVNLSWKEPEKVPPFYRSSPGFGLKSTEVYFPVSQDLALIGQFDGEDKTVEASDKLVAVLNTKMLYNVHKQIYAPTFDFKFWGQDDGIFSCKHLLREIGAQQIAPGEHVQAACFSQNQRRTTFSKVNRVRSSELVPRLRLFLPHT